MKEKTLNITLDENTYNELEGYAIASEIKPEQFITALIHDFLAFQQSELDEVHLNDDGETWLIPAEN
ncbi:MAG: hypothetical protein PUB43_05345 [Oscillospiraceae bacterium]|nr:hypothetical protein [Oscillospiraceae bacterium]